MNTSYFAATVHWQANYNGGYEQTFQLRYFESIPNRIHLLISNVSFLSPFAISYRLAEQGNTEWKTIRVPPPETTNTFTLYNLQSDNEYEFQVYAVNRLGAGSPSPIIKASTKRKIDKISPPPKKIISIIFCFLFIIISSLEFW